MKQKLLSNLEQEIMEIVWEHGKCSVRDVLNNVKIDKKYAYTTVATILSRLYEKELVIKKENKQGYFYSAKVTKESYSKNLAQTFLKKFFDTFGDVAVASFAESIDILPTKKRHYLLTLLENHDKNK